ncbi:AAA family ATPase [Streptomyces sp. JNUCC 64]
MTLYELRNQEDLSEEEKELSGKIFDAYRRGRPDLALTYNPENHQRPYHCGLVAVEMELGDDWPEGHHVHDYWCTKWPDEIKDEIGQILKDHKAKHRPPFPGFWHDSESLDDIPPLVPLLEGIFYRKTLSRVVGHSASMKSFVMLSMAAHMGWGEDWHGCRVQSQGVKTLMVVAEGSEGIKARKLALEQFHGRKLENVYFLTRAIQIDPGSRDWQQLTTAVKENGIDLVVFDTQSRCTVGLEENSNREMAQVVATLDKLIAATGVAVCLVHHSTGDQSTNGSTLKGRGAGAVRAALQSEIFVKRDRKLNLVTVSTDKAKDAASRKVVLEPVIQEVNGLTDYWGSPETSVVLVSPTPKLKSAVGSAPCEPADGAGSGSETPEGLAERFQQLSDDRPTVSNVQSVLGIRRAKASEVARIIRGQEAA